MSGERLQDGSRRNEQAPEKAVGAAREPLAPWGETSSLREVATR